VSNSRLKDLFGYWITINEPVALAFIFKLAMEENSDIINEEESSDQSD
jgi:hypothetical protein